MENKKKSLIATGNDIFIRKYLKMSDEYVRALCYLHTSMVGVYRKPSKHLSKAIYHFYVPFKRIKLKFVTTAKNGLKKMKNHMAGWKGRAEIAGESTHHTINGMERFSLKSYRLRMRTRAYH